MRENAYTVQTYVAAQLMLICLIFSGCASMMEQVVPIDQRIMLTRQEGDRGSFVSGQLTVTYNYSITGNNLAMKGLVSHRGRVDSLDVRVLFFDGTGQIIDRRLVYSTGFRSDAAREGGDRSFQKSLTVPPGATGFSFSYSSKERIGRE